MEGRSPSILAGGGMVWRVMVPERRLIGDIHRGSRDEATRGALWDVMGREAKEFHKTDSPIHPELSGQRNRSSRLDETCGWDAGVGSLSKVDQETAKPQRGLGLGGNPEERH